MSTRGEFRNARRGGEAELVGLWSFADPADRMADGSDGPGAALTPEGDVQWISGPTGGGAAQLDGLTASLGTSGPVLDSERSFSVAVWARLDSALTGPDLALPQGWYAVTVLAQEGPTVGASTHCIFYLGARIRESKALDGSPVRALHWCLNVAPVDGSQEQRDFDWEKAFSSRPIGAGGADRWTLLVGVVDVDRGRVDLHVRTDAGADEGHATLPDGWPHWQAAGSLRVGRALWLSGAVDHWPGAVGPVRVYSGILGSDDVTSLFAEGNAAGA